MKLVNKTNATEVELKDDGSWAPVTSELCFSYCLSVEGIEDCVHACVHACVPVIKVAESFSLE